MKSPRQEAEAGPAARAAALLERLIDSSAELRTLAVFAADGSQLAATTDELDWAPHAARLWTSLDVLEGDALQVHVAMDGGEVFAIRDDNGSALAVSERFALASLVFSDLRAALRVAAGGVA